METQINELYPIMPEWEPSASPLDGGQSYRLQKINEIQRVLEDEREKRHNLSKKYHKAVEVVGNIDSALVTISMGLSVAGVFYTFYCYCGTRRHRNGNNSTRSRFSRYYRQSV